MRLVHGVCIGGTEFDSCHSHTVLHTYTWLNGSCQTISKIPLDSINQTHLILVPSIDNKNNIASYSILRKRGGLYISQRRLLAPVVWPRTVWRSSVDKVPGKQGKQDKHDGHFTDTVIWRKQHGALVYNWVCVFTCTCSYSCMCVFPLLRLSSNLPLAKCALLFPNNVISSNPSLLRFGKWFDDDFSCYWTQAALRVLTSESCWCHLKMRSANQRSNRKKLPIRRQFTC